MSSGNNTIHRAAIEAQLLQAVRCGDAEATRDILARNPPTTIDINGKYDEQQDTLIHHHTTLLHEAGSAAVVRLLLTSPPPPHQPYSDVNWDTSWMLGGGTPLWCACFEGREDVVRELLGVVGVDPNKCDPLRWASWEGCAGVARLLLGHPDTDVNRVGFFPPSAPLAVALIRGNMEVAQMIAARGGTVNKESQAHVDEVMGGHDKYEQWLLKTHQQVDDNYNIRIRQLEKERSELNQALSAMASSLSQLEQNQQSTRKEKIELEAKHNTEQSNSMGPKTATTMPELNEAFRLASLFQTQLKKSAPQFLLLQESLEKLDRNLEGGTKHNEELASHLQKLSGLKGTLVTKLNESDSACKKILGKNLTVWNSEAEIQECSRKISSLTKMWGMKGMMAEKSIITVTEGCEPVDERLLEPLIVPLKPHQDDDNPFTPLQVLCTLTDTLAQLQSCRFDECTKLAGKHTVLSKELSEQETLGGTLHKAIQEMQRECSELQREHKSKWMLQRGLEGDERFIGIPGVWSMLSELLPQAQQAIVDLMVCKATSSGQQQQPGSSMATTEGAGTTLSGCAATSSFSSCQNNHNSNESNVCVECEERPPDVQLQPCGHVVLCSQCAAVMKKCPDCRSFIKGKVHL
ncbi:hypothetical protein Pelo_9496 [Pelomyxa schiedti]|nr:hypothetical protein Pelo_9496 [Pelomyxa schiedti]